MSAIKKLENGVGLSGMLDPSFRCGGVKYGKTTHSFSSFPVSSNNLHQSSSSLDFSLHEALYLFMQLGLQGLETTFVPSTDRPSVGKLQDTTEILGK